jgi:uncharacterized protein YndB with AHSA1/START domain
MNTAIILAAAALMAGKTKTDRTIRIEVIVDTSPDEVYRLWTTREGVQRFFAPDAIIEPEPGGRYEIHFAPARDPEGLSHGTRGARVLQAQPGRALAFEWITFAADSDLGESAPPVAAPEVRNARPLPTWVELSFAAAGGGTRVTFAHYGFRHGALWDGSYAFFKRAWKRVLAQLVEACRTNSPPGNAFE